MPAQALLRVAVSADADAISALYLASRKHFLPYAPLAHSDEDVQRWIAEILIPSGEVYAALVDGETVGMLALSRADGIGWIDQLYLHPRAVGQGIGSLLVDLAKSSLGAPIRLFTFQANAGARRFYERHGFEALAFGDGAENEEHCPDVLYEWRQLFRRLGGWNYARRVRGKIDPGGSIKSQEEGASMKQSIVHIALVVKDYDEAIAFYTEKLHFTLIEDTYQPEQDKRWVVVAPPGSSGTTLLLARASKPEQEPFVGNQSGGRVFLFLNTDDFWRDYNEMAARGIKFVRLPKAADYGLVAVFEDLYGNLWDLLQLNADHPLAQRDT